MENQEESQLTSYEPRHEREYFMRMALSFAVRGTGYVRSNPRVGCVIVKNQKVVGWGYHRRFGGAHAEIEALRRAKEQAEGATLYVNLEPCSHYGKTPPCVDQIIEAKIGKVVAGIVDPNPAIDGKGLQALRNAGIQVDVGVLERECKWTNRGFLRRMQQRRPWVTVKSALSIDGDLALDTGESKWISNATSRQKGHILRAEHDAILVGIGTVLQDDPELTVRLVSGISPLKVILDRHLKVPENARILEGGNGVIFCGPGVDEKKLERIKAADIDVTVLDESADEDIPLRPVLEYLAARGVNMLMVEGGTRVISNFFAAHLVDEVSLFVAPRFLGRGLHITEHLTLKNMQEAITLGDIMIRQTGTDIWIEGIPSCSPAL